MLFLCQGDPFLVGAQEFRNNNLLSKLPHDLYRELFWPPRAVYRIIE